MQDSAKNLEQQVCSDVLKIPEPQCPPNHYILLGLHPGETDPSAIENGAKTQSAKLRQPMPAELQRAARLVLRRIATARVCLLDPNAGEAYFARLKNAARSHQARSTEQTAGTRKKKPSTASSSDPRADRTQAHRASSPKKSPPDRRTATGQKSHKENGPLAISDFDDLLASLPDAKATPALPPARSGKPPGPIQKAPDQPRPSRAKIYSLAGGLVILAIVVAYLLISQPQEVADEEPGRTGTSEQAASPTDPNGEQMQEPLPGVSATRELPLAKRINNDTRIAKYSVAGGVLAISIGRSLDSGMAIPINSPIVAYVIGKSPTEVDSVDLEFDGASVEGDYFNVHG